MYIVTDVEMTSNYKWVRIWKEAAATFFEGNLGICLERLRGKIISQNQLLA